MKKLFNKLKHNTLFGIIIGILITSSTGVLALNYIYNSDQVSYGDKNVKEALDELFSLSGSQNQYVIPLISPMTSSTGDTQILKADNTYLGITVSATAEYKDSLGTRYAYNAFSGSTTDYATVGRFWYGTAAGQYLYMTFEIKMAINKIRINSGLTNVITLEYYDNNEWKKATTFDVSGMTTTYNSFESKKSDKWRISASVQAGMSYVQLYGKVG